MKYKPTTATKKKLAKLDAGAKKVCLGTYASPQVAYNRASWLRKRLKTHTVTASGSRVYVS